MSTQKISTPIPSQSERPRPSRLPTDNATPTTAAETDAFDVARVVAGVTVSRLVREMRVPLDHIISLSSKLSLDPGMSGNHGAQLARIRRHAEHQRQVLNDLLELDVLERQSWPVLAEQTAVLPELQSTLEMVQRDAEQKGVRLRLHVAEPLPLSVRVDRLRLRQALLKLLLVAIRNTENGEVRLSTRATPDQRPDCVRLRFDVEGRQDLPASGGRFRRRGSDRTRPVPLRPPVAAGLSLEVCEGLLNLLGSRLERALRPDCTSAFQFELRVHLTTACGGTGVGTADDRLGTTQHG